MNTFITYTYKVHIHTHIAMYNVCVCVLHSESNNLISLKYFAANWFTCLCVGTHSHFCCGGVLQLYFKFIALAFPYTHHMDIIHITWPISWSAIKITHTHTVWYVYEKAQQLNQLIAPTLHTYHISKHPKWNGSHRTHRYIYTYILYIRGTYK